MPEISGSFELNWLNARFIRTLARGYYRVDGQEHEVNWKMQPISIEVEPGKHKVEAYIKYKGFNYELGRPTENVSVQSESFVITMVARNSIINNVPFRFVISQGDR